MSTRAVARHSDPETSHEAAASVGDLRPNQEAVKKLLRRIGPSMDEKLVAAYLKDPTLPTQAPSGIRSRRKELVRDGFVRHTGDFDHTSSGRRSRVWEVIDE